MPSVKKLPASVTTQWIGFAGLLALAATYLVLAEAGKSPLDVVLGLLVALIVSIAALDLWFYRDRRMKEGGLDSPRLAGNPARVFVKLTGLAATYAVMAFIYWVLPEYRGEFYEPLWQAIERIFPYYVPLAVVYFYFADARMRDPKDGYWHAGCAVLGKWDDCDWPTLKQYALGWLVKGFFLPLMFIYMHNDTTWLLNIDPAEIGTSINYYEFLFRLTYAIDVAFATAGYLMTLRVFGAHIRSVEPTLLGWSVAIVCYQPFWSHFSQYYIQYQDDYTWGAWLAGSPNLWIAWAAAITVLNFIYLWATITFGLRFSNLTHRGILTNGPYRFGKHPAYVAKNLSWWMIAVPFLPVHGWGEAVRQCVMLLGLNMIYYLRAKTEERHLSWDSTYVAYARWIDEHGLFATLKRRAREVLGIRAPVADNTPT